MINGRIVVLASAVALCVASAPVLAQPPAPPGELIDIGGRRLHLHCTGNGSPAVIVENGDGAFSIDWSLVQPTVSKTTKICTYDRTGYAWSDRGPIIDMVEAIAADLHLLLLTAKVAPPYVFVGASMGGAYVRAYQRRYPDQIVGLVLVDATHDEGVEYVIDGKGKPVSLVSAEELRLFMKELLAKNPPPPGPPAKISSPFDRLPESAQAARLWCTARFFSNIDIRQAPYSGEAMREEFVALRRQRVEQAEPLGDLPMVVLARTINTDPGRKAMQAQLAVLSRKGRLVMAEGSGHEIHLYRPDLVIRAINEVVESSRRNANPK